MRRRTVRDWTPDLGDGSDWLADLESEGWVPEYGAGVHVRINARDVVRYALIDLVSDQRAPAQGPPARTGGKQLGHHLSPAQG